MCIAECTRMCFFLVFFYFLVPFVFGCLGSSYIRALCSACIFALGHSNRISSNGQVLRVLTRTKYATYHMKLFHQKLG